MMENNKITVLLDGMDMLPDNNSKINLNEEDSINESKSKKSLSGYETKKGKSQKGVNGNNSNQTKKKKQRRSRLIMSEDSDSVPEHRKEIYEGEAKLEKSYESAVLYNTYINTTRYQLSKHFLKRKIKQNFEREDKNLMFFNVKFLPKPEMFPQNNQHQQMPPRMQRPPQPYMNNPNQRPPLDTNLRININQRPNIPIQRPYNPQVNNIQQNPMNNSNKLFQINNSSGNATTITNVIPKPVQQQPNVPVNTNGNNTIVLNVGTNQPVNNNVNQIQHQGQNPNVHHHSNGPLDSQKKEKIIKRITEKYLKDPEQLKRELGEEEFKKIEKYLIKKGLIPIPQNISHDNNVINQTVTPQVNTNPTPQQKNNIIPPQKN